jgi:hypothetical protein
MASTVDVEMVEFHMKDSPRVEGMLRGKEEEHASTV